MYFVFVFTIGLALLLLETSLGRKTGQSSIGAFKAFGKKYAFIGIFMSAVPFIIVPYYCVIWRLGHEIPVRLYRDCS